MLFEIVNQLCLSGFLSDVCHHQHEGVEEHEGDLIKLSLC